MQRFFTIFLHTFDKIPNIIKKYFIINEISAF